MGYVTATLSLLLSHLTGYVSRASSEVLVSGDMERSFGYRSRNGEIYDMEYNLWARCALCTEGWQAGTAQSLGYSLFYRVYLMFSVIFVFLSSSP